LLSIDGSEQVSHPRLGARFLRKCSSDDAAEARGMTNLPGAVVAHSFGATLEDVLHVAVPAHVAKCGLARYACRIKIQLVVSDPSIMMGKPVIVGTRITVESILERLATGESIADVVASTHGSPKLPFGMRDGHDIVWRMRSVTVRVVDVGSVFVRMREPVVPV
jgi:hypothetical protein